MPTLHPCSTYVPQHPKAATLNATTPPCPDEAQRRTRHLSVCQELIDLGMKLARAAAERALYAHEQATAASTQASQTPPPRDPDLTFSRLAAGVRQAVTLEARLASNAFARLATAAAPDTASTDRKLAEFRGALDRGTLEDALTHLTDDHADSWQLQQTFGDIIEDTLSAFPDDALSAHFARACLALGIAPDLASLPPDLGALLEPAHPKPARLEPAHLEPAPPDRWPRDQAA